MGPAKVTFPLLLLVVLFNVASAYFYEEWITQPVNPIDSFDNRRWQNRYFVDSDSYVEGGPIFVHLGGPDFYLAEVRMNLSHFLEIGKDMGALLVFTEHRFYGQSRPTLDTSLVSLQYLDTRYALADVANLIVHLRSEYGNVPVIAHGYDHGGALAVWMRQRYPELIDGVWASSASLHARKDFGEYLVNIGEAIRSIGGDQCYNLTEDAFTNMGAYYDRGDFDTLEQYFDVCQPLIPNSAIQEAEFFAYYTLALSEILRYAHSFGIETLCDMLDDHEDPMEGLANFIKLVLPVCANLDSYNQLYVMMDEGWDTEASEVGSRQLAYQYCREFGWFKAATYLNQPFGRRFPIELFQEQCAFVFGPSFTASNIIHMMDNTNRIFGGLSPNVTKVYFTDGALDPAKSIGIMEPFGEEIYVDMIPDFAAGAEILISSAVTSADVRLVQERARELIGQWVLDASRK